MRSESGPYKAGMKVCVSVGFCILLPKSKRLRHIFLLHVIKKNLKKLDLYHKFSPKST